MYALKYLLCFHRNDSFPSGGVAGHQPHYFAPRAPRLRLSRCLEKSLEAHVAASDAGRAAATGGTPWYVGT